MLSPADVVEIAHEEGLGDYAQQLATIVQPAWRLTRGGDDRPGVTKVGGDPDLAPNEDWPLNRRGVPMAFVAQINCSELPEFDPPWRPTTEWRHGNLLVRLFAYLLDNPVGPGPATALQTDAAGPLTPRPAPTVPDPFPPGGLGDGFEPRDVLYRLPETFASLQPFLTAPEIHADLHPETVNYEAAKRADQYEEWAARLRVDGRNDWAHEHPSVAHLLGTPTSIQDDVRYAGPMFHTNSYWSRVSGVPPDPTLATVDAWQVLLGLHSGDPFGLGIHDGGALHFLVPKQDLATGRLDRMFCTPASS